MRPVTGVYSRLDQFSKVADVLSQSLVRSAAFCALAFAMTTVYVGVLSLEDLLDVRDLTCQMSSAPEAVF